MDRASARPADPPCRAVVGRALRPQQVPGPGHQGDEGKVWIQPLTAIGASLGWKNTLWYRVICQAICRHQPLVGPTGRFVALSAAKRGANRAAQPFDAHQPQGTASKTGILSCQGLHPDLPPAPCLSCTAAFVLHRRPVCFMVPPAPATRSGGCSRCAVPCPTERLSHAQAAVGAEPVGAVIRRPAGRSVRRLPIGGRSAPAEAAPPPVARLLFGAPGLIQGPIPEPIRAEAQPALDSHGAAFPWGTHRADAGDRSSCQSFPQRKSRASPLVARLARVSLHPYLRQAGPHPASLSSRPKPRALSRAARIQPGGAPEFRTE